MIDLLPFEELCMKTTGYAVQAPHALRSWSIAESIGVHGNRLKERAASTETMLRREPIACMAHHAAFNGQPWMALPSLNSWTASVHWFK